MKVKEVRERIGPKSGLQDFYKDLCVKAHETKQKEVKNH
jgi:hypothetical protein